MPEGYRDFHNDAYLPTFLLTLSIWHYCVVKVAQKDPANNCNGEGET